MGGENAAVRVGYVLIRRLAVTGMCRNDELFTLPVQYMYLDSERCVMIPCNGCIVSDGCENRRTETVTALNRPGTGAGWSGQ